MEIQLGSTWIQLGVTRLEVAGVNKRLLHSTVLNRDCLCYELGPTESSVGSIFSTKFSKSVGNLIGNHAQPN